MNKKQNKNLALFIGIWGVLVLAYNAVLFTIVANIKAKESLLHSSVFWILYGWMMFVFLLWLIIFLLEKPTKAGNIRPMMTFVYPYFGITFVITTFLYFFATKIKIAAFVLVPIIIITALVIVMMILGLMHRKQIEANPQTLKEITRVEELTSFFQNIGNVTTGQYQKIVLELAKKCEGLTSSENEKTIQLDKRLIEYALFIKKNALNEEINIENNIKMFENLLKARENGNA